MNPVRDVEEYQSTEVIKQKMHDWFQHKRSQKWESYRQRIPPAARTPAQEQELFEGSFEHHQMLRKAESSAATQIRSGKIGLNAFLNKMKVPGIDPNCKCGWPVQDAKHVLLFCPESRETRPRLLADSGTSDFREMLTSTKGIRAAARWIIQSGGLSSYKMASEQLQKSSLPSGVKKAPKPKKGAQVNDRPDY